MEKPTLLQLRREHNQGRDTLITSQQLATMAVVPLHEEYVMELGRPTSAETARRVIDAFSALVGRTYALSDISVILAAPMQQEGALP